MRSNGSLCRRAIVPAASASIGRICNSWDPLAPIAAAAAPRNSSFPSRWSSRPILVPCHRLPTSRKGPLENPRDPAMPTPAETVIATARDFLGDRITTNATLREHHSHGQDTQPPLLPDAVAFVETTDEAARLLALCNTNHVPVVAWGAGTSLEGHVSSLRTTCA